MQTGFQYTADPELKSAFDLLPKADYRVRITECKYEATRDGLGTNFNFKYTVQEGQYKNRTVFDTVAWTWDASHQKAVDFGKVKFNNIMLAIGLNHFQGDTDEFIGGEMVVEIGVREYEFNGEKKQSNQVNKYKSCTTGASPIANSAPQPTGNVAKPVFGNPSVPNPFGGR